jgi:hypothetical protein
VAKVVKKFDLDQGWHPREDVDVQAVVVRWDAGLQSLIIDLGGVHPSIAVDWLAAAIDRLEYDISEVIGDAMMLGETEAST